MDPGALQLQEVISLAGGAGAKFQVSLANGNVVVVPLPQSAPPPPLISDQISSVTAAAPITQQAPISQPPSFPPSHSTLVDNLALNSADESLADLQPEDSEGEEEEEERAPLTPEQKKLEFMAALGLVPPAVLEEIHRRQQLCRAEYGNWWDRLHSTDFCLVPKNDSALSNLQIMTEAAAEFSQSAPPQLEVTQIAARPDTGSLVEQITYLTSWPQSNTSEGNTVEVVTTHQPQEVEAMGMAGGDQGDITAAAEAQALREHYMSLIADRQQQQQQLPASEEHSIQAALQQLTSIFTIPH